MPDPNAESYIATRVAESKKALEWISAYNSNPDLAISLLPLFNMSDEDIRFMMRTLNSLCDSLYFHNLAVAARPVKKKSSKKKTSPMVEV